jgi:3-hydroxyacyl-CoA dehydrogenase
MGTHFFSPANVMKLLVNVKGAKTSELTIASMMAWGKRIGKTCILVGNCNGFVGNRMVNFYSGRARKMMEMGLLPENVDGAAGKFGMRMGPIAMSDLVGLDLGIQAVKKAGAYDPAKVIDHALIEAGRLGQKNSKGFYDYDESRKPKPSPAVAEILKQVMQNKGSKATPLNEEQVIEYLLYPMINEAFNILSEGIAQRPSDIDVCYCNGYSFPRNRGGPMFYADTVGLPKVKSVLDAMGVKVAPLLAEVAGSGKSLAEYWAAKKSPTSKL